MKLTRFEKAKIIGSRALQISMGAPVLIKVPDDIIDPIDISIRELEAGVVPITVKRGLVKKKEKIPVESGTGQ
jgi:DNA-directed RNA polymerase subunit K